MATAKPVKSPKHAKLELSSFMQSNNIIKASQISDTQMLLNLESGKFSQDEVWFMKNKEGQEYIVMPQSILKKVVSIIRDAHEEKLALELARDVSQSAPIDFDDVMAVALRTLESKRLQDGFLPHIDTKTIVQEIKKNHPNLFFDFRGNLFMRGNND